MRPAVTVLLCLLREQAFLNGNWADLYFFKLDARSIPEFEAFSDTTARSHPLFTKSIVVTKPLDNGRVTPVDLTYKVVSQSSCNPT
jgi:hypothetical protein